MEGETLKLDNSQLLISDNHLNGYVRCPVPFIHLELEGTLINCYASM